MLTGSVGQGGENSPEEVKIVQLLLNDYLGRNKRPLLQIDGIAGPLTNDAILKFQTESGLVRDGRVDSAGPTLKKLLAAHFESISRAIRATSMGAKILRTTDIPRELVPPFYSYSMYVAQLRNSLK